MKMKQVNPMRTTTLFNYYKSELIKKGLNEFVNEEGKLIFFDSEKQFIKKIFKYDSDIQKITDELFNDLHLKNIDHDYHFKKMFIYRFLNREINRQTIESFQLALMQTFLANEEYIHHIYTDISKIITGSQTTNQVNSQLTDGTTTTDSRSASSELPQNNVQLDVNSSVMETANDNTISKNKQSNKNQSDGQTTTENQSYQIDQLLKANGLMDMIIDKFDRACFLQIW